MKSQPLSKAFVHAFRGMEYFFTHDRNGRIHLLAAVVVSATGYYAAISATEWAILLLCMAMVISFEMLNHALEKLCDLVHSEHHPLIKTAKDVAAAAVLWSALISALVGLFIFIPKFL